MKYDTEAYEAVSGKTVDTVTEEHLPKGSTRIVFIFTDGAELEITTRAILGYTDGPYISHHPIRLTPPGHSQR